MTVPESKLDEWQQIADGATEGPWFDSVMDGGYSAVISPDHWTEKCIAEVWGSQANADFIAEARSMVPQLLEEVRRLQQLVNVMGDGLDVVSVCEFCGGES